MKYEELPSHIQAGVDRVRKMLDGLPVNIETVKPLLKERLSDRGDDSSEEEFERIWGAMESMLHSEEH